MRRLTTLLGALLLAALLVPSPAQGADTLTVKFSGTISFWDQLDDPEESERVALWAPMAPPCGQESCPSAERGTPWVFEPGPPGSCTLQSASGSAVPQTCTISITEGALQRPLVPFPLNRGPWCGWAGDSGPRFTVSAGANEYQLRGLVEGYSFFGPTMEWRVVRPGTGAFSLSNNGVASLVITEKTFVDDDDVRHPSDCGQRAPDFLPSNEMTVTGTIVWGAIT